MLSAMRVCPAARRLATQSSMSAPLFRKRQPTVRTGLPFILDQLTKPIDLSPALEVLVDYYLILLLQGFDCLSRCHCLGHGVSPLRESRVTIRILEVPPEKRRPLVSPPRHY